MKVSTYIKAAATALALVPAGCHRPNVEVEEQAEQQQTETVRQVREVVERYGIEELEWRVESVDFGDIANRPGFRIHIQVPRSVMESMQSDDSDDSGFSIYTGLPDGFGDRWVLFDAYSARMDISVDESNGEVDVLDVPIVGDATLILSYMSSPVGEIDRDEDVRTMQEDRTASVLAVPSSAYKKLSQLEETPDFLVDDPAGVVLDRTVRFLRE